MAGLRVSRLLLIPPLLAAGVSLTLRASGSGAVWEARGEAIVTCPCSVPCPCRSNGPPSQPHCENLSYVRFVEGKYGNTSLAGLEYVWAANECTGLETAAGPTHLYFPVPATPGQVVAVEHMMRGPEKMRVWRVPFRASARGGVYAVSAPGRFSMEVDLAPGAAPMEPLPALDLWGNTVTYARNLTARMNDARAGLAWDASGRQANYRSFDASGDLLRQGLLLAQYRDDIGRFNEMHRSLIRELHLELPLTRADLEQQFAQARDGGSRRSGDFAAAPGGSIGGTVLDGEGTARSGARVTLTPDDGGAPQIVVTNPAGRFFLARVAPGRHRLCALTWDGKTAMQRCEEQVPVLNARVTRQDLRLGGK